MWEITLLYCVACVAEGSPSTGPLQAPTDCPEWSCVCKDEPEGAAVAAPNDCGSFIICNGQGGGVKEFCAAGTVFSADTESCAPSAPADEEDLKDGSCPVAAESNTMFWEDEVANSTGR